MWRWGAGWGATNFASLRLFAAGALARHPSRLPISGKPTWPMTASGAAARQAAAGELTLGFSCSEFPRVPYHKRHEQPCDGRSQLATAPCEPGDEQQGAWRALRACRRAGHRERRGAPKGRAADMNALRLTDQQLALPRELAAPLAPSQRAAFLQEVARRLHGVELVELCE